jgi:repressor LexA
MGQHRKDVRQAMIGFIEEFWACHGYSPSYDEIREALDLSGRSHVKHHLDVLEEAGRIEREPHTPRGLRLVGLKPATFEIAMLGAIAAGEPLQIFDRPGDPVEITSAIADPRKNLFALRVKGDSMVDALVSDGDILIVESQHEALRGQMAVVHLRERSEVTLKRFYPEGGRVRLQPAHPTMPPFYVDAADVEIQGRVVAIIRRL